MRISISRDPQAIQILGCLFLLYLAWGSGFLATHFAIQVFPPFMMLGIRMTCAGILLILLSALRGNRTLPTRADLKQSLILAFFMVFISGGLLTKGQETVASGTAALILGAIPIWMSLAGWLFYGEKKPGLMQSIGLLGGFSGLLLLSFFGPHDLAASLSGISLIFIATLSWVFGSFYSKQHASETKLSIIQSTGLFMLIGGCQSLLFSLLIGEMYAFDPSSITLKGLLAVAYAIFVGAIIGYTCYFWLLLHTRTIVAISFEFVTPIIGVFLGWWLAGEAVNLPTIFACALTTISVFFVISEGKA